MRRWVMVLPLVLFLGVAAFLYRGLYLDPAELPSALIGKPFPAFSLPAVQGERMLSRADLLGKPALVNVWGTVRGLPGGASGADPAGAAGRADLRRELQGRQRGRAEMAQGIP